MHISSPDLSWEAGSVSRRSFVQSCSVLALCLAGCQSVAPRTRFAARMLVDPPEREYRPVLRGLIRAVLPFEHPSFPALTPGDVETRLLGLFPVQRGAEFAALQRGLMFFDDLELFPHLFGPLVEAEGAQPSLGRLEAEEWDRYERYRSRLVGSSDRFTTLTLPAQRSYFQLWVESALATKRQFARSAKSLIMITAYSMDTMWSAIGYEGPVLESDRATG